MIPFSCDLTRKENDLLLLACKKDKRDPKAQVRWLVEAYGLGLLKFTEEGAELRNLLHAKIDDGIHYPDSVTVSKSPTAGTE